MEKNASNSGLMMNATALVKVAIVTNVIPNYRHDFYRRIINNSKYAVHVFCQSHIPGMNLIVINNKLSEYLTEIPFLSLPREKLAWQFLPFRRLLKFDVIIIYGNPRVISNVFYSLLLRVFGKQIVIWGQAHTSGSSKLSEMLRLTWWRLFKHLFVYTDHEIDYLEAKGFSGYNIIGMNNGLNQDDIDTAASRWDESRLRQWRKDKNLADRLIVLSVARLEKKNRFEFFVDCLPKILQTIPNLIWCVIGTGIESENLRNRAKYLGISENIRWLGAMYDENELAPWFLSSQLLVHPGAIGLSLLHAFGYGLPVLTHGNDEKQMPEFHALVDQNNGLLYRENDEADLFDKSVSILTQKKYHKAMANAALKTAREGYNSRIMAERFVKMVDLVMTAKWEH